ncbi:hypothetical protein IPM62_05285 [Candidatus Woesebacteria bacterium]|nr:MAG: hypothetical protein IPM62_05285 [Candidatus Woesebacteria bacterium]
MQNYKNEILFLIFTIPATIVLLLFIATYSTKQPSEVNNANASSYLATITVNPSPTPQPTITPSPSPIPTIDWGGEKISAYITFYGWPDNTPSGNAIAYPNSRYSQTLHNWASGIGTFNDPLTIATDPSFLAIGTKIYIPLLQKYGIVEDLCEGCVNNVQESGRNHIDVWMESNDNHSQSLVACQHYWTRQISTVVIHPSHNLPVNSLPLFNKDTGECLKTI